MEASQILQKRRQGFVNNLARNFGESHDTSLSELLPHLPDVTKPMFESLIEEINSLISRVRRKIEQNQRLLLRLAEVTDQILGVSDPVGHSKTYSKEGKVGRLANPSSNLREQA